MFYTIKKGQNAYEKDQNNALKIWKRSLVKLFLLFFIVLFCFSCGNGVAGKYSATYPRSGYYVPVGYHRITLGSDRSFKVECVECYPAFDYGKWEDTDNGIRVWGLKERKKYNGNYTWEDHIHARGVGKEGKVLENSNGRLLFRISY